jgi:hypothetical protein
MAFEAVMRVRASRGVRVAAFHGKHSQKYSIYSDFCILYVLGLRLLRIVYQETVSKVLNIQ